MMEEKLVRLPLCTMKWNFCWTERGWSLQRSSVSRRTRTWRAFDPGIRPSGVAASYSYANRKKTTHLPFCGTGHSGTELTMRFSEQSGNQRPLEEGKCAI